MPVPAYVLKISFTPSYCISYISIVQIPSRIASVIRKHGKSLASVFYNPIIIILIQRGV